MKLVLSGTFKHSDIYNRLHGPVSKDVISLRNILLKISKRKWIPEKKSKFLKNTFQTNDFFINLYSITDLFLDHNI